jgi:hypothetical protein
VENVPPIVAPDLEEEARRRKREAKQLDAARPLGAWELYRALNDAMDEGYDLFDLSNREARFALILMGGLNAALVVAASQSGLGAGLSTIERRIEGTALAVYALLALAFLLRAINALRPGQYRPHLKNWPDGRDDFPIGIRYYEDVVERDTGEHWAAWRDVKLGQLNAELAIQVHSLCLKNQARKVALRGLYGSLRVLTLVFAAILILFLTFTVI